MKEKKYLIGIDLGGTKILTALSDRQGKILTEIKIPTEATEDQEHILNNILKTIQHCLDNTHLSKEEIECIGIGVPGPVDYEHGILVHAPNIPKLTHVPLKSFLEKHFNVTTKVANDAHMAAIAEMTQGAGIGYKHVIYVTASTGIGSCIVIDGNLYLGTRGLAGEIGHTLVRVTDQKGNTTLEELEHVASGSAIKKQFGFEAEELHQRLKQKDPIAVKILGDLMEYLSLGLANVTTILNPQLIIIGGGLSNLGDQLFIKPLEKKIKERAFSVSGETVKVVQAKLKDRSGILGAIALCSCFYDVQKNLLFFGS
ncbi:MAG: ROK family protein [Gammaproteobacteria bacterium]|nr:ROK family protein [Gammaproteobacteria bacterium]